MNYPAFARLAIIACLIGLATCNTAHAYIEIPYTLGKTLQEANWVVSMRVEKVDKEKRLIVYRKIADLKGSFPDEIIKHQITDGFRPDQPANIMAWAEVGKIAVFFHNGGASETCIDGYWYQSSRGDGGWWSMTHAEPYFLRWYCGKSEKLAAAVTAAMQGQEVVLPCMVDSPDKEVLHTRTARIQRLRASLKIIDYDPKRDFVGWGGDELHRIAGMPGYSHFANLSRSDPLAGGAAVADFEGGGKPGFCLFGANRAALWQNGGNMFSEASLPAVAGARAAAWADYNGDGKADLLLATPSGPRLFTNRGTSFRDDTACLAVDGYWNLTAATWMDYDGDGKPDILLADGFRGLRLLHNIADAKTLAKAAPPKLSAWRYFGPLDNPGGNGFQIEYPPERSVDYQQTTKGKRGLPVAWIEKDFSDGQINNLALFADEDNSDAAVYVHREIEVSHATELPVSLGSDDTLTVWLNGQKLLSENVQRAAAPDQHQLLLKLKPGKNSLLMKICQGGGEWAFYFKAGEPAGESTPLFEDVSNRVGLGLHGIAGQLKGDHLAVADVDGDGRPDVLFSAGQGVLLLNTPQGFVEAKRSGIRYQAGRITPAFGSAGGNGSVDLLVPQGNRVLLFKNDGHGTFTDATASSGELSQPFVGATCAAWSASKPGAAADLYVGCVGASNRYYRNAGNGKFVDESSSLGLDQRIYNTQGIATFDHGGNGAVDLILNNRGQDSVVLLAKPKTASK